MDDKMSAIREECVALYHKLGYGADRDFLGFDELFSDDIVWTRPGNSMIGIQQVREFINEQLANRAKGTKPLFRHMFTSIWVEPESDNTAHATACALLLANPAWDGSLPSPIEQVSVVEYRSTFKRIDGRWKITRHNADYIFKR